MAMTIRAFSNGKSLKNPTPSNNAPAHANWQMPAELGLSIPRPVRFTAAGRLLMGVLLALASGAVVSVPALLALNSRNLLIDQQLDREGVQVEAQVIELKSSGEEGRRLAFYRYDVGGRVYRGKTNLRQRDARKLQGTVPIRYFASDPSRSWVAGYEPREVPLVLIAIHPSALLTGALLLWLHLRGQRSILEEGRAVEARVISTQSVHRSHQRQNRIEYEFQLLSGATRRVKVFQHDRKLAPGSTATLLYDRENPKRVAIYPMSTVAVDRT
jgi:hypothetical protein